MPEKTLIHGFSVVYEPNASGGVHYLMYDLDLDEAKVFFNQARQRGEAEFEDDLERKYTLFYKNGIYTLTKR